MRPNASDLKEIGPTFTKRWQEFFADAPDKPVMWIGQNAASVSAALNDLRAAHIQARYVGVNPAAPRRKYFSVGYYTVCR